MPFVIPLIPIFASIAGATGFALFAITVASALAGGLLAAQAARKQRQAARDAYNASLRDRTQMVRGTVEGRDLVLGRVRKSGHLSFIGSAGATKEKLLMVISLAGHEIDGVEAVWFNDEKLTLDGSGYATTTPYAKTVRKTKNLDRTVTVAGTVSGTAAFAPVAGTMRCFKRTAGGGQFLHTALATPTAVGTAMTCADAALQVGDLVTFTYDYNETTNYARVRWMLGSDTQAADARLMSLFPAEWTTNHRLRGVAYLIVELDYNDDIFSSGIPNVSTLIRGAKVYDPRSGTTAWSMNPALCFRHYALSPLGGRLTAAQIDDASIIAAANVCDISVNYIATVPGGATHSGFVEQFRCGYVAKSGMKPQDALDDIAESMAGKWVFVGDKLKLKAGAYTSPVLTLTDDDFGDARQVQIQPTRQRDQQVNIVTGVCVDDRADYRVVDMPRVIASAYVTADGGELPMEVEFAAVPFLPQAQHVAGIMLRDARNALTITAPFKMSAYRLEVLETVAITNSRYGWSAKTFEILSRRWTLEGLIELTMKETTAAIYTPSATFEAIDLTPNTLLPSPWNVPAITGLAVTSSSALADGSPQTRMRATWTASTWQGVLQGGTIELAWIRVDQVALDVDWSSQILSGSAVEHTVAGLTQGTAYLVKIRAATAIARSDWSPIVSVIIAGVYTGDSDATNDLSLVAAAGVVVTGNTVTKVAGTVWDASAYSRDSYTGGAYASAIAMQTNRALMFGLNTDPTTDSDYVSIDYAWYVRNDGTLAVYESGTGINIGFPAYATGDVLSILYDGVTVRYLHNGLVRRTVTAPAGLRFYFDSAFSSLGGAIGGIRFGPMSAVTGIDTPQLVDGAATDSLSVNTATQSLTFGARTGSPTFASEQVQVITFTNNEATPVDVEISASSAQKMTIGAGAAASVEAWTNVSWQVNAGAFAGSGSFATTPLVAPGSSYSWAFSGVGVVTLAPGDVLNAIIYTRHTYFPSLPTNGTLVTENALIRLAVIKR